MKIKQKKQLNLPQLIEWAWDNKIKSEKFIRSDSNPPEYVWVNENSEIEFDEDMILSKNDIFTVEVEEFLTEDTVIPELVELYEDTLSSNEGSNEILINENISIRRAKDEDECPSRAFYIINDDLTLDLIWTHDKGLVE